MKQKVGRFVHGMGLMTAFLVNCAAFAIAISIAQAHPTLALWQIHLIYLAYGASVGVVIEVASRMHRPRSQYEERMFGVVLPQVNSDTFDLVRAELRRRRTVYVEFPIFGGGRVFAIPESDLRKLPKERGTGAYYIPVNADRGFAVYFINFFQIPALLRDDGLGINDPGQREPGSDKIIVH